MRSLLVATGNPGKARELRRLVAAAGVRVVTPADLGLHLEVEETGLTFEDNAVLKARAFADASRFPTVADDSGLEVDALGGLPGVRSARFAGEPRDDAANLRHLLHLLRDVPPDRRSARFVCVAALALPGDGPPLAGVAPGGVRIFRGECPGTLALGPRGRGGFGYDPLFVPLGHRHTFAELDEETKDALSHRGNALRRLADALQSDAPGG